MSRATSEPVWRYGEPVCVIVGKRPKVEFLGAGVKAYGSIRTVRSSGNISTSQSTKSRGAATTVSALLTNTDRLLYGSWSEYEAVTAGRIQTDGDMMGTATGAATGNYGLVGSRLPVNNWSRQTITNADENNFGDYTKSLLSNISIRLHPNCSEDESMLNVCSKRRDLINGMTNVDSTYVQVVDGNATIRGNITYANGADSDIVQLPQAIIYVKGDLNIHPNVTRIDAWLIVEGVINTCATVDGIRGFVIAHSNQNQHREGYNNCNNKLVFNGPVIAGKVLLNRVGGSGVNNSLRNGFCHIGINSCASTGPSVYNTMGQTHIDNSRRDTSGDPAEVFNLRSDAFLWSLNQAIESGQIRNTYTREAAPRL